jgi:hypothetical protein
MIVTWSKDMQTGQFSRIANPRIPATDAVIEAIIKRGKRPNPPTRNTLAGFEGPGLLSRLHAWLRGER